jgi:hypothetical protein
LPKITATWRKSVESIIETGRLLVEAKASLAYGQFGDLIEKLPFSHRTAQCLMRIAEHRMLVNPHTCAELPASWRALAELARIPEERWAEAKPAISTEISVQKARILANRLTWDGAEDDLSEAVASNLTTTAAVSAAATVTAIKAELTALRKVARKARYDTGSRVRTEALIEIESELGRIRDVLRPCRCGGHR